MSVYVLHVRMRPVCVPACLIIYLISVGWEPGACGPARSYCMLQPGPMWVQPGA